VLVNGVPLAAAAGGLAVGLYYGLVAVERVIRGAGDGDEPERSLPASRPCVTVQEPVYNERAARRRQGPRGVRLPEVLPNTGILT